MPFSVSRFLASTLAVLAFAVSPAQGRLLKTGHDDLVVDPAHRRFTGAVTAVHADRVEPHHFHVEVKAMGAGMSMPADNEMRDWRMTVLAGERFLSVFRVVANSRGSLTLLADGPSLEGLRAGDVFVVEETVAQPAGTQGT